MVEYLDNGHLYINSKGVIIPSVSQLVSFAFPNSYKGVPEDILRRKAMYGTELHEILEKYDNGELNLDEFMFSQEDPNLKSSLQDYIELKEKYKINPVSQEQIISYKERFAGRYDKLDANGYLWDVKSTVKENLEKWACQLGLYYLALGIEKKYAYIIYLPKGKKGKVIMIEPWSKSKCLKLLRDYEKEHKKK